MRESCTSGSVRGARGNSRPYRNQGPLVQPKIHNVHVLAGQPAELDYLIERRVADEPAVPVVLSIDGGPRGTRGPASARQDVFGGDFVNVAIDHRKLPRLDVYCREHEPNPALAQLLEGNILGQRSFDRGRVVEAGPVGGQLGRAENRVEPARAEEARRA